MRYESAARLVDAWVLVKLSLHDINGDEAFGMKRYEFSEFERNPVGTFLNQ